MKKNYIKYIAFFLTARRPQHFYLIWIQSTSIALAHPGENKYHIQKKWKYFHTYQYNSGSAKAEGTSISAKSKTSSVDIYPIFFPASLDS